MREEGIESHNTGLANVILRDASVSGTGDMELISHFPYTAFPLFTNEFLPSKIIEISKSDMKTIPLGFHIRTKTDLKSVSVCLVEPAGNIDEEYIQIALN